MKEILTKINAYNENKKQEYDEFILFLNQDEIDTHYFVTEGYKIAKVIVNEYIIENKICKLNDEINELTSSFLNSDDIVKSGYQLGLDTLIDKKYSTREKEQKIKNAFFGLCQFVYETGYNPLKKIIINQIIDYSSTFKYNKINLVDFFHTESKNIRLISELIHHGTNNVIEIYSHEYEENHFLFYLNNRLLGEAKKDDFKTAINDLSYRVFSKFIKDKFENDYLDNIHNEIINTTYNDKRLKLKNLFSNIRYMTDFGNSSIVTVFIDNTIVFVSNGNNQEDAINKAIDYLYQKYFYDEIADNYKIDEKNIELCSNWDLVINHSEDNYNILWNVISNLIEKNLNIIEDSDLYILINNNQEIIESINKKTNAFEDKYNLLLKTLWNVIFNFDISLNQLFDRDIYFCELFEKIEFYIKKIEEKYETTDIVYLFDEDLKVNLYIDNEHVASMESDHPVVALHDLLKDVVYGECQYNSEDELGFDELSEEIASKWASIVEYYHESEVKIYCPNSNENYYVFTIDEVIDDQLLGNSPLDAKEKLICKVYDKVQNLLNLTSQNHNVSTFTSQKFETKKTYIDNTTSSMFKIGGKSRRLTEECLKAIFSSLNDAENIRIKLLAKFNSKPIFYRIENERVLIYLNNEFLIAEQRGYNVIKNLEKILKQLINTEITSMRIEKNNNNTLIHDSYEQKSKFIIQHFENEVVKFVIDNQDHQHVQFLVDNQPKFDFKFKNSDNVIFQAVDIIYNYLKRK